jgi:hypothetical protein
VASFSAKRLILVEQMKKNGINKEISKGGGNPGRSVNQRLTMIRAKGEFLRRMQACLGR